MTVNGHNIRQNGKIIEGKEANAREASHSGYDELKRKAILN